MKILGLNITRTGRAMEQKEDPTWKSILAVLTGQQAVWTPVDYANLAKAGYQMCAPAFACSSLIARSAAGISWYVSRKASDGTPIEIENHPLGELLAHPNESDHSAQFIEKVVSFKLLAGNSYILRVFGVQSQPPQYLYAMRPDRVLIKPGTIQELVGSYFYRVNGIDTPMKREDVLHIKDFHPLNDFYGLSRLEVAARSVDISNASEEWNAKLLQNDMRPSGAITIEGSLNPEQRTRTKADLKEHYQGSANAGTPLVLEGGLKWQQLAMSPKDMDWTNAEKNNLRRICSIFGVASELMGDGENKTYSNIKEARRALYMETVLPIMDDLRDALNRWLSPLYGDGIVLDYDRDAIEALQEERAQKYAYLNQADWLTVNEKRDASGYDQVGAEGDVILVGIGKVPLEQAVAEPAPVPDALAPFAGQGNPPADNTTPPADESGSGADNAAAADAAAQAAGKSAVLPTHKSSFWTAPERKERLWRTFEGRVKSREKSFENMARAYIKAQADATSKRAERIGSLDGRYGSDIFNVKDEAKRYAKSFTSWYIDHFIRAGNAGMRASKCELFDDSEFKSDDPKSWTFNMTPEQDAKLKKMIFESGTKVNETTLEVINRLIREAQDANMTVEELAQSIGEKIGDFEMWRARLWSRTESAKVDNYGQVEGYKETEFVDQKGWMCSFVPESREEHIAADSEEVPVDDDFRVGGESLAYPGDPQGSAGNVCNCLCSTYPVVGDQS